MKVFSSEHVPIKCWANNIDESALEQAKNLANLPFVYKWVALMPDCHAGHGMPIGGVLATKNVIIPNAVGDDIGCGMIAVNTNIKVDDVSKDELIAIRDEIINIIPMGTSRYAEIPEHAIDYETRMCSYNTELKIVNKELGNSRLLLGTLGGGNHFIELQKDTNGYIWIMLHSGSRHIGYTVAKYYNKIAENANELWFSSIPKKWRLAFLPVNTNMAKNYIAEMNFCIEYALMNREIMMYKIINSIKHVLPNSHNMKFNVVANIVHNYVVLENHYGANVWVHRKGATSAKKFCTGIIPGSQGSASYIVEGLGNPESFMSCSHGAGRVMSRRVAKKTLSLDAQKKIMNDAEIIHGITSVQNLDEAPGAYKNIDEVMENQKDLVNIVYKLTPIVSIKRTLNEK